MKHQHEALAGFPVVMTLPVLWGDQDPFGHVNNLVYLRWCETVRVEYMVRAGMWVPLPPQGVGPILASIQCDYKLPLNYPDTVHVGARVTRIGNSSMRMEHLIVSHKRDELAAAGRFHARHARLLDRPLVARVGRDPRQDRRDRRPRVRRIRPGLALS